VIGCHRGAAIRYLRFLAALIVFGVSANVWARDKITIAAAADLKFAMGEVVAAFTQATPRRGENHLRLLRQVPHPDPAGCALPSVLLC